VTTSKRKIAAFVGLLTFSLTFAAGMPTCWGADGDLPPNKEIVPIDQDDSASGNVDGGQAPAASDANVTQLQGVTVYGTPPSPPPPTSAWGDIQSFLASGSGSQLGVGGSGENDAGRSGTNAHPGTSGCASAHPVVPYDGNKVKTEVDFTTQQLDSLQLVRTYNHYNTNYGMFGNNWTSNFGAYLLISTGLKGATKITTIHADGSAASYNFSPSLQVFIGGGPDSDNSIISNADGTYTLQYLSGASEHYNGSGLLIGMWNAQGIGWTFAYNGSFQMVTATHTNGQTVQFSYTGNNVSSVKDPAGSTYTYTYNSHNMLTGVTYPNGDKRTYFYENSSDPTALTGIAVNNFRYSTYSYNSSGTVYQSGLLDGTLEQMTFSYNTNASTGVETTTMTNAAGAVTTNTYAPLSNYGFPRLTQVTQAGITNCPNTSVTTNFDTNGNPSSSYDERGIETTYTYTAAGLLTDEVTGIDSSLPGQTREIQKTWDANNRVTLVKLMGPGSTPISQTAYNYNPSTATAKNRLSSIVVTNLSANGVTNQTQTTNFSYSFYSSGMPSQIVVSGPLAGSGGYVATNYDSSGNITSAVDALGHTTTYSGYNGLGQVGSVTEPNGSTRGYTYDPRGNVITTTETNAGVTGTTSYTYDGMGDIESVTFPSGGWVQNDLDGAGRVTLQYTDLSNTVQTTGPGGRSTAKSAWRTYSYSNVKRNQLTGTTITMNTYTVPPPGGGSPTSVNTETYVHSWGYDSLGRLTSDSGANGQSLTYTYDQDGNVLTRTDSLGKVTSYTYTAQNQVLTVTDPLVHVTRYTYDGAGHVASITDPKGNVTSYVYDGFGNMVSQTSPDSHTTTYSYNGQGLPVQMTRNDGTITSLIYDSMNRVTKITAGTAVQTRTYDTCTNGAGHLCSTTDSLSGATDSFTYRQNGQIASQHSIINGTGYTTAYAYDSQDRLVTMTYPDGSQVSYSYDTQSNITAVGATIGGTAVSVASAITYSTMALGPAISMKLGQGGIRSYSYDGDFRLTGLVDGANQSYTYGYDADNRLTTLTNNLNSANSETFGYDQASKLTAVTSAGLGNQSIAFDANGNRTSAVSGGITDTYTSDAASNRENSISGSRARTYTFDALGNTKTETGWRGNYTYTYDGLNRLTSPNNGGTAYSYNALNQRVRKTGTGGSFNYVYAPTGTILGETASGATALTTEYIWLAGAPIGIIRNGALYSVHNDHLGRPEVVTNSSNTVVWQSTNAAFSNTPTTNTFGGLNLGFPGQYFDAESGLWYNGARFYDATTGRYIQSDLVGLAGGFNTYAYAFGNPILLLDPTGTTVLGVQIGASVALGGVLGLGLVLVAIPTATVTVLVVGGLVAVSVIVGGMEQMKDSWPETPAGPAKTSAPAAGAGSC
jgi:RHS repeat-associated protein